MAPIPNNPAIGRGEGAPAEAANQGEKLNYELVEEVAAKVYAMLLRDLKIESERRRWSAKRPFARGG
jgi:hypothetical protein